MKEGVITSGFGWYNRESIQDKIVFPSSENVFGGIKPESFGLGYKYYPAFRCMACQLIVVKIQNENMY